MFTQFFGNYLLNENYISTEQLLKALTNKNKTKLKLGVIAMNAGYMTSEQVEHIHMIQTKVDKRFGTIAVENGYVTEEEIEKLLSEQKSDYLLLGQALIDSNAIDNTLLEKALNDYKSNYQLDYNDFMMENNDKISDFIKRFYSFSDNDDNELYTDYLILLFNNLIRFIGDDFTPLQPKRTTENFLWAVNQDIEGSFSTSTSIISQTNTFVTFASRYAKDDYVDNMEYIEAAVCDFLNLHNGLFLVNMSCDNAIELSLTPPSISVNPTDKIKYIVPICYPFGIIYFTLS